MRYKYLILMLLLFLGAKSKQTEKSAVKEMLLGYWQQSNDSNSIILITNDSLKSFYKGKLYDSCKLTFNFPKTEGKYFNATSQAFRFDLKDTSIYKLELIDSENTSTFYQVNYVDKDNLEIGYNAGIVSFKRINPTQHKLIK